MLENRGEVLGERLEPLCFVDPQHAMNVMRLCDIDRTMSETPLSRRIATVKFTLLTKENCPLCDHAKDVIARVGVDFMIETDTIWLESPEGESFAARHETPFPPVLVIDGVLHGYGRLSEKKLRRELERLEAPRRRLPGRIGRSVKRVVSRPPREDWWDDDDEVDDGSVG